MDADMSRCTGWAYERCDQVAAVACRYSHADGSWQIYPLCLQHVDLLLAGIDSEYDPPTSRTWAPAYKWQELIVQD